MHSGSFLLNLLFYICLNIHCSSTCLSSILCEDRNTDLRFTMGPDRTDYVVSYGRREEAIEIVEVVKMLQACADAHARRVDHVANGW